MRSAMMARTMPLCPDPSGGGRGERARTFFVSGALGAGLLAAALAFPAGEARAQTPADPRNQCGALVSGEATCSDQRYRNGIRYDVADGWVDGVAGDVALTVTGGPATTIQPMPPNSPDPLWASPVVVRTAAQGADDSTTRTIDLKVGEDAAVAINRGGVLSRDNLNNIGIFIHQRGNAADATTVTLGSDVAIGGRRGGGSQVAMGQYGVYVLVEMGGNTATHTITSAATISSNEFGLLMDNRGAGDSVVTNSGSITVTPVGGAPGHKSGIRILDWSHNPAGGSLGGDSRTASTKTTVTNSGSITVGGRYAHGIHVTADGLGLYKTVNSGTVSASGSHGHGILVEGRYHSGAAGSEAIEIENSGVITAVGHRDRIDLLYSFTGVGIYVETAGATDLTAEQHKGNIAITNRGSIESASHAILVNANMGAISVTHSGDGTVSSSKADGILIQQAGGAAVTVASAAAIEAKNYGIFVFNSGAGTVSVTHSAGVIDAETESGIRVTNVGSGDTRITTTGGEIMAGADGIHLGIADSNTSGGTIVNAAAIDADGYGLVAWYGGEGEIRIENSGAITAGNVGIHADEGAAGAITIMNGADVMGDNHGIFARNTQGEGAVSVTHSAGEVRGKEGNGIAAFIGRWRNEDSAESPDPMSTASVEVKVTGGSVHASETRGRVAIEAGNFEGGSAEVTVSKGAEVFAKHNAGIYALLSDRQNTNGRIMVAQGGTIEAHKGVYASVSRAGTEERAAAGQPLIDVEWTGTFTEAERTLTTLNLNGVAHAIESAQEAQAGEVEDEETRSKVIRGAAYTAGIDAEVMSWRVLNRIATRGDDPGPIADKAAQDALFAADADAATKARAAAIIERFRTVLTDETLGTIPGAADIDTDGTTGLSDAEIVAYLSVDDDARRTELRDILARHLSETEKAVLRAVATGGSDAEVDAALDGVTGASDAWKNEVRALLNNYNTGNIRVTMNGGSIDSTSGDGIRAWYARQHDRNGAIAVTVAEGASVTGGAAGVYVANAGTGLRIEKKYTSPAVQDDNVNLDADDLVTLADHLDQVVRVHGTVTGGADAAVHLAGGGALIVSRTGKLVGGSSGQAILVNDPGPAVIYIEGEATGGEGAEAAVHLTGGGSVTVGPNGRVRPNGADKAILADNADVAIQTDELTQESAGEALARVGGLGGIAGNDVKIHLAEVNEVGVATGHRQPLPLGEDGNVELGDLPRREFTCATAMDGRCRLYEALPSILLAMNDLPSYAERTSAVRDANGAWARVEMARGEWQADKAATAGKLAYDHRRAGGRAGVDVLAGETGRVGVSMHVLRGKAEMTGVGEAELDGTGAGLSATWLVGDLYVDVQGGATWYDAELDSATGSGRLVNEVDGRGYALGLDVGNRMVMGEDLVVTPRAGLAWSKVDLDDFMDEVGSGAKVSVRDARSTKGRVGVMVDTAVGSEDAPGRVFGSVDVEHEFSDETSVDVSGNLLETTVKPTGVRLGLGGTFSLGEDVVLRARADYTTSGGDTSEYGGGLELNLRF